MKKRRILFIASLPSKKHHLDGERNKSGIVFECIRKMGFHVDSIDYTRNKYFQTLKLLFFAVFKTYDYVFISKCAVGGSVALHLILLFAKRKNKKNIIFYLIGNGFKGFENKIKHKEDFKQCYKMIVESQIVVDEMNNYGIGNCAIFPCIKEIPNIDVLEKHYSDDETLKLIFFSRITKNKGLSDAIEAVQTINKNQKKYTLDIAGGVSIEEKQYEKSVIQICDSDPNINYFGESFFINGIDSYKRLQQYDLHIFPSRFFQECAPGSIIDMFIAGIPTISSEFENAHNILNKDNSYFFAFNNLEDLIEKLEYIYSHKQELNKKRSLSHLEANKYSDASFIHFLEGLIN